MKPPFATILAWSLLLPLHAQDETSPQWSVEIPVPVADGEPSPPAAESQPVEFEVLESRTTQRHVIEAPEMADLPPVQGNINVTMQLVKDPQLREPEALQPLPPQNPAVQARLEALRKSYRGRDLAFISATVYNHSRTLLRIFPDGKSDGQLTVWTNLDFNHFSGFSSYRVHDGDGTYRDHGLLMGIGNIDLQRVRERYAQHDLPFDEPEIPELPQLASTGPAHVVVEGDTNGAAMAMLLELKELYRKEGARMKAAFHAREQARAERKAFLLANPPQPEDVTVRFWKRSQPSAAGLQALEGEEVRP